MQPMSTTSRVIRMNELVDRVGYAPSTIYALIKDDKFPKPFKLTPGGRANGWLETEINKYLSDRSTSNICE